MNPIGVIVNDRKTVLNIIFIHGYYLEWAHLFVYKQNEPIGLIMIVLAYADGFCSNDDCI